MADPLLEPLYTFGRRLLASKRRILALALLATCFLAYSARDALFVAMLRRQLEKIPDAEITLLSGHVHALLNGATLTGVQVFRPADPMRQGPGGRKLRLAEANRLEVRWPWRGLLRGALSCEVEVAGVEAHLWRIFKASPGQADGKAAKKANKELAPDPPPPENLVAAWPKIARFVLPVAIDEVAVSNARFWLHDCTTQPEVKWPVEGIALRARNLTNREHLSDGRYATVDASAAPAGGKWTLHMELDPLAKMPTFGLRCGVEGASLRKVNPVLRAYAKLDVESGTFAAQVQVKSEKGHFDGFVEPRIVGLKIRPQAQDEQSDSFLNRLWRSSVRAVAALVENNKEKTIATRMPLAGQFLHPELGVWDAVTTLLGNAYLQALQPPIAPAEALPLLRPKKPAGRGEQAPKPPSTPASTGHRTPSRAQKKHGTAAK